MSESKRADGRGQSEFGAGGDQLAARIAQRLRDAGLACEIVDLVPTPTVVLRRDRIVIVLAVALLTGLAWSYLLWLSADMRMGGMDMTGFRMIPSGMGLMMPADAPWRGLELTCVFIMWIVMMVGMMTPSLAPMLLMYARIGRQTEAEGPPVAPTVSLAAGYFLVWVAFALVAALAQWALDRTALLDFRMASTSNVLGGLVFIIAGLYQWTRLNDLCLAQCQRPFAFLMSHGGFRRDTLASVTLGLRHGAYCVGCCWTLMALLLVGGVMNVLWIVLLAFLVFLERVTSMAGLIARIAGVFLIAGGAWLFSMVTP